MIKRSTMAKFLLFLLFLLPQIAEAHPPKSVDLSWNPNGTLTVTVSHNVNDPAKHYIGKVIVYVDDKIAAQKEYTSQTSAEGLTDTFDLGPQRSGANLKAEASCIIMGSLTGETVVP